MDDADGLMWSCELPPVPPERYYEVVNHGTIAERLQLANIENLSREILDILAEDSDFGVLLFLVGNSTVPPDILDNIVSRHPELTQAAATNPNASPGLKDVIPIVSHSELSIWRYLKDRQATEAERELVMQVYWGDQNPKRAPLLRDVWRSVRSADGG